MSESKKRQNHSAQFKAKVGLEAIQGLKTINELGREHGVHPVQVEQWKRKIQERTSSLFEGKRGPKVVDVFADPEQMLKKIGQLEMERNWLKKSWESALEYAPTSMQGAKSPLWMSGR